MDPNYLCNWTPIGFSSVQSLSHVRLFATPWIAARQASLSITNSRSSLTLTSIESVMPSSHFILCRPPLLLPPVPPSIRVFSNESTLCMRWPKWCLGLIPAKWQMAGHSFPLCLYSCGSLFQVGIPSKILPLLQLWAFLSLKSMWWLSPSLSRTVWVGIQYRPAMNGWLDEYKYEYKCKSTLHFLFSLLFIFCVGGPYFK